MTTRPTIRPSSTRPRLPISVDGEMYRALPSPSSTSPVSRSRSTRSASRPATTLGTRREHPPRQHSHSTAHDNTPYSASYRHRIWEDDRHSRSSSTAPRSAGSMMSPSATLHPQQMEGYFPNQFHYHPTPDYPPHVIPLSEAPRNPSGGKKQQSGRKRTACDRCKRQKSSCIEAFVEDPLTGRKMPKPGETRCQRCAERNVKDCTITNTEVSYARPTSAKPHQTPSGNTPLLPEPASQPETSPIISDMKPKGAELIPAPSQGDVPGISPGSEVLSQTSQASTFWKNLFEEDASVRKRIREDSPQDDNKKQGNIFLGNSHMGPSFVQEFVNATSEQGTVATLPVQLARPKRPDYRAEKLLRSLPGNEKEMDRYIDRFFDKYNFWADVIDESDFRAMYKSFKHDHCFSLKANRASADLRDLSLIYMVLAFGVVLDHTPLEEVNKQNISILLSIPEGEGRDKARECLAVKDAGSMTLNRREEMSSVWAGLARSSLVDAQSASMGDTINSISAWVLVAWYAIHGRKAEEGWSVLGQAARQAMASGFHIDGSHRMYQFSDITAKEKEQRRRVWAHMVIIDTSVSLYLGRPHAIFGGQRYTSQEPANIAGNELFDPPPINDQLVEDAADLSPWQLDLSVYPDKIRGHSLANPTRSTFLILHLRLAYIIGRMQLRCFGLKARKHEKDVVECEAMFEEWAQALPPHFKMQGTDHSLDTKAGYGWLKHQRKNLHSKYYIARISLHRPYLLATVEDPDEEQDGAKYESSKDACMLSAVADLNLRTQTEEADPLDRFKWVTVASGFNPALIMGIVCFFNAQHHKYQVQELLGLLSKYLEVESKTLRTGPVLQEELRALKFLYKSASLHIKLEQNVTSKEKEGEVATGSKRSEEEKGGEKKRTKYSRPFLTSVPLDMSIDSQSTEANDTSAPIPLPQAHRQLQQQHQLQLQTPGTSGTFPDFNLGNNANNVYGNGNGNGIAHTFSPFPHIPSMIQNAVNGFANGDQDLTTYTDYSLPTYPQVPGGQFDISAFNAFTNTNTNINGIGINPTPSPNTEANVWAALGAITNSGNACSQVLSSMDVAGAQIGEISPPSSLGDLPGSNNYHLAQNYEGYGYGASGLGIQLGHTPTPMHAGTYYNPVMAHPQPHINTPQANQYLLPQSQSQSLQQIQAMRRQSFPLPQTHTQAQIQGQGQRWSQGMIQNGLPGGEALPQTHEAAKVARSNSMWAMPSKP